MMALDRLENRPPGGQADRVALVRRPCLACGTLIEGRVCGFCGASKRASGPRQKAMRAAYVIGRDCVICGDPAQELDHIRPIAAGGTDRASNLQPLCRACNRTKGAA
jgi:5-methylcytosine-specific restriction endonuclease McrA